MTNHRTAGLWILPAHVGTGRGSVAALQREFARIRTLEHPNIARVHELGHNGEQYFVRGEHLDGEPLRDVLVHLLPERLEVGEADSIVRAIGAALVYSHEHGVVHGDVRPDNVIVTMDRRFVLTNFLARSVAKNAARPARPADDLRGLARIAAELYTGSTAPQALRSAAHGNIPAARLNAIRAVLEAPPTKRPSDVAEFLEAADLAYSEAPATVRRAPRPQRSWSLWRLVLPMAGVAAIGVGIASYHSAGRDWQAATMERGVDMVRAVASRVAARPMPPPRTGPSLMQGAPEQHTSVGHEDSIGPPEAAAPISTVEPPAPAREIAAAEPAPAPQPDAPATEPPAPATARVEPATAAAVRPATPTPRPAAAPPAAKPAVLSLDLAAIAAREDHTVIALDVVRSGDTSRAVSIEWQTVAQTARESDDYVSTGKQVLRFAPGQTTQPILIPLVNDAQHEGSETFIVSLTLPRGASLGSQRTTRVTLYDDD